jgi:hypothetical protein
MSWFLDYEGYHIPQGNLFIIKEIAILHSSGDRCYNYFIKGPKNFPIDNYATYNYQFDRHMLRWEFGDYEFVEAMMDIAQKLRRDNVYIKGSEKYKFISSMFPSPNFIELVHIPAFKYLNNCMSDRCEVKHGNNCARRKVHELRHAAMKDLSFFHSSRDSCLSL